MMDSPTEPLLENSRYAFFAAIEIHNKPIFSYRYQVATVTIINAWELLLKAFIAKNLPEVRLIYEDNTSKQFEECLSCVKSHLGKSFLLENESIETLYRFRCEYIHFYTDGIDTMLFSLFSKNVELYNRFIKTHFEIDLSSDINLVLLPIGFKPPISPIDFLSTESNLRESSEAVKNFIEKVLTSTKILVDNEIDESIMTTFNVALINENRINNADIIAAIAKEGDHEKVRVTKMLAPSRITNDPTAQTVRLEETSVYNDIYTDSYAQVVQRARERFSRFIQNQVFHEIMKRIKADPRLHKIRYLDVHQTSGTGGKSYFSKGVYDELAKHYGNLESGVEMEQS
ncbi:MAG: DUF3644 domain-containing protein [Mucilaginibacter sp.]